MATFYGYLHGEPVFKGGPTQSSVEIADDLSEVLALKREFSKNSSSKFETKKGWSVHDFLSEKPLLGEDEDDLYGGPYPYPFYVLVNPISGNVIIGSIRYSITNIIVERLNYFLSHKKLQRLSFDVQKIRQAIESDIEKQFFATHLQLEVNSFSSKIDSLSLTGDDILGVNFLTRFGVDAFTAKQIGLRVSGSTGESVRLLRGGGMQFYSDKLRQLETCLGFVSKNYALFSNY